MKVVSLIDSEFFTMGKVYTLNEVVGFDGYRAIFDDKFMETGELHFVSPCFIFTNFSVLTFEEVH